MQNRTKAIIGGVAVAAGFAGWGGVALAAIPDSNTNVYTACISTTGSSGLHTVYMNDAQAGEHCPVGYNTKTWNQTGPAGPTGATGAAGATGATGPAGPGVSYYRVTSAPVSQNSGGSETQAYCTAGDTAVGGGVDTGPALGNPVGVPVIAKSIPYTTGTTQFWDGAVYGPNDGVSRTFTVTVVCAH